MLKVGDKVRFVRETDCTDFQNLGVGVVTEVTEGRLFPVSVFFTGFDYKSVDCHPYHPCMFEELEKLK